MKTERYIDRKGRVWAPTGDSPKQPDWRLIIKNVIPTVGQTWVCVTNGYPETIKAINFETKEYLMWRAGSDYWTPETSFTDGSYVCIDVGHGVTYARMACDCGGAKARTTHSHWCSSVII